MKKDILKEEFEKEIDLPESLSKNNIVKMLQEKGVKPERKAGIKLLPKVLSAAAMFIIPPRNSRAMESFLICPWISWKAAPASM